MQLWKNATVYQCWWVICDVRNLHGTQWKALRTLCAMVWLFEANCETQGTRHLKWCLCNSWQYISVGWITTSVMGHNYRMSFFCKTSSALLGLWIKCFTSLYVICQLNHCILVLGSSNGLFCKSSISSSNPLRTSSLLTFNSFWMFICWNYYDEGLKW